MLPRPPGSTRTYPLFPVTTLFRSGSDRPRSRHGVAGRADRAELQDATGSGGTVARWRHRGPLRQWTRSPAPPARARGHVRLASVPAGTGVRHRLVEFPRATERAYPPIGKASLRERGWEAG